MGKEIYSSHFGTRKQSETWSFSDALTFASKERSEFAENEGEGLPKSLKGTEWSLGPPVHSFL